ncbi:IS66 family insertion sequence element accessory protein TnpB [Leisingera sp.]|uniref:IS66 family insertion sequence element accessory protein TnpB n=1 Tax=Leisingera sp. TaxID=1879318 RepID=UPI003A5C44B9
MWKHDYRVSSGAFFVFRSEGRDKMKILIWDGTGLVLVYKRIEGAGFVWPKLSKGTIVYDKGAVRRSVRRCLGIPGSAFDRQQVRRGPSARWAV